MVRSIHPSRQRAAAPPKITSYWERTLWPLQSLYFLLPLLLLYELGTLWLAPAGDERLPPIYAERMMGRFFEWFGVTGYYLPGIATAVVLLCWHIARRDSWRIEPRLYGAMFIESAILAAPLFVFSVMLVNEAQAWSLCGDGELQTVLANAGNVSGGATTGLREIPSWREGVVFSIGAGIYEELVFRLIAIALLHLILADALALPSGVSGGIAIAVSAVMFALYHPVFDGFNPLRWSSGEWGHFAFYTLAGVYFAGIYVSRGFGIVAATHALYDVMVVTLHFRHHG